MLLVINSAKTIIESYILPFNLLASTKAVVSGNNYLIYNDTTDQWYTNIPLMTILTYTYIDNSEFTQVPTIAFSDQNLWLAMNKTLWIANLVDDKLSALAINNNEFSNKITNICPISSISKAIFFENTIILCEEANLSDGSTTWRYYPLKFSVGVRATDTVITTNDGKMVIFPTKYGLAVLAYQLDIAATDQAITYITDDIKTLWFEFYNNSTSIKIIHHNTQLILSNGTNIILIFDFRTLGWYPLTLPININISSIQPDKDNYELLNLQSEDASYTELTGIYQLSKERDELYNYTKVYKDLGTHIILWHLTSQLLLLEAPNHYKKHFANNY